MIVALTLTIVALCALAALVVWRESRPGLLAQLTRRRAIVTLKSGEAFEGLVFAIDRDCLILREASALAYGQGATNVVVQGEAVILRADVAYLQFP